jgi:hypothetical protein
MISLLRSLVDDAQNMQRTLTEDTLQMSMAIEQRQYALQVHKMAKSAYDSAEAEFLFDLAYNNEEYIRAKNAEAREVVRDRALVVARQAGVLAQPWRILNECALGLENMQTAYDQAEVRFKSARICAELMAAQLMALSADARLLHA